MKYSVIFLLLIFQSCISYSQSLQGNWSGKLDVGAMKLGIVLHVDKQNTDWSVVADSPDQGVYGMKSSLSTKGDSVFFRITGGIEIRGKLINDSVIHSTFYQNGANLPLVLTRTTAKPQVKTSNNRHQEPQEPFSYLSEEVEFSNEEAKIILRGTLTRPKNKGKYPAVILVSGSGPQNRDEELFGHKPFKVLSDYLTRNGIVVLRYDERGVGKSEGTYLGSNISDFSKDAVAAFDYLKTLESVDINKLGIIGHSEGGLIATLLAAQAVPNLSFIVSLAGPAISIDKLMVEQLYAVGKAEGMSEVSLAIARKINEGNFAIAKSDMNTEEAYEALLKNMNIKSASKINDENLKKELLTMLEPSQRYFYSIETERFLPKIYIPVFAAYGDLDIQVPSTINLKSLHDYLHKNSKTVLKEYVDLNHLFQKAQSGRLSEYAKIEETFNEQVMKDIAEWIKGL